MELDLTRGSVLKNVVRFSLPYLLSYFLQTLYGMADLFIIGQYAGVEATTAVSVGSQVMHMLTVMIVGLAMGTTVSIAQSIGAKDHARTAAATGSTVTLFLSLSLLLTGLLLLLRGSIVSAMSTPEEAVALAGGQYLRGYIWDSFFAGIQFSFSGYFCACGRSGLSFLHNFLSIVLVRIPGAYAASRLFPQTLLPMGLANAAGSLFSILVCVCAYLILTRRRESRLQEE